MAAGVNCGYIGCDEPHHAKSLCHEHYLQLLSGLQLTPLDADVRTVPRASLLARIAVLESYVVELGNRVNELEDRLA